MKPKTNQAQITPYERLQDQMIRSRGQSLEALLDLIAPDVPVTIQNIRFGNESISMTLRWPFLLPLADDPGEYLGTVKAQARFREGLRKCLSAPDTGKHLSNALFKELRKFVVRFTGGHRLGERVSNGLNSTGERRMAGRPKSYAIEKLEANRIRCPAQEDIERLWPRPVSVDWVTVSRSAESSWQADTRQSRSTNHTEIGCRNHSKRNI
jgi:hypothetical protein